MSADKKLYKQALDDVREQYRAEIEKIVLSYIAIRDNENAEDKDIINANKGLTAILGVPRPTESRVPSPETKKAFSPQDWETSPEENERIQRIIDGN